MAELRTELCGVTLKNPVIAASGTFGFGEEYGEVYELDRLGAISVKGLTLEPRTGNPPPRIAETPSGMLNSVGLQNPGVKVFIEEKLPILKQRSAVVIANIAGNTVDEYCKMARLLSDTEVDMIELNISCPNVKEGGVAFGIRPESVLSITRDVARECKRPLIVKLSPNTANIKDTALAAQEGGANAISLINTLTGMMVDVNSRRPILANRTGGLSGPAVFPVALRMVWEVASVTPLPIVGMGGIMSGEDAAAFMLCGAKAVMVGTANIVDPLACVRIIDELGDYLEQQGETDVSAIVGALID